MSADAHGKPMSGVSAHPILAMDCLRCTPAMPEHSVPAAPPTRRWPRCRKAGRKAASTPWNAISNRSSLWAEGPRLIGTALNGAVRRVVWNPGVNCFRGPDWHQVVSVSSSRREAIQLFRLSPSSALNSTNLR